MNLRKYDSMNCLLYIFWHWLDSNQAGQRTRYFSIAIKKKALVNDPALEYDTNRNTFLLQENAKLA